MWTTGSELSLAANATVQHASTAVAMAPVAPKTIHASGTLDAISWMTAGGWSYAQPRCASLHVNICCFVHPAARCSVSAKGPSLYGEIGSANRLAQNTTGIALGPASPNECGVSHPTFDVLTCAHALLGAAYSEVTLSS